MLGKKSCSMILFMWELQNNKDRNIWHPTEKSNKTIEDLSVGLGFHGEIMGAGDFSLMAWSAALQEVIPTSLEEG